MTERNAYTGRFRKAGAVPAWKLSPEAEAEIERLTTNTSSADGETFVNEIELSGDDLADALRAAMSWAYADAAKLCSEFPSEWPHREQCAAHIRVRGCVKP